MKKNLSNSLIAVSVVSAALLFSACGGSDGTVIPVTSTATTTTSGQLVDNYVADVNYTCADGASGVTDENGTFECSALPVTFQIGGLVLGKLDTLPEDGQVFPQDLLQVQRTDVNNSDVIAMARFLQSCDDDNNTNNGIKIRAQVRETFQNRYETFNPADLESYAVEANLTLVSEEEAVSHLEDTVTLVEDIADANIPLNIKDAILTPQNELSQATKDTLSFMGNEERLAHDVYLELYNFHIANGNGEIQQLTNIATRSETTHIQTVQSLINKYDLDYTSFTNIDLPELAYKNTSVDDMLMGTYDIKEIQDLHDALIAKGQQSVQDALEVGCMVEVTDIDDLLVDIQTAKDSNASDVVTAFEFLRDGSYSHYWSFDTGLKNMGITDGCCSLGDAYCHPEYPQDTKGADASSGSCDNNNSANTTQPDTRPLDGTGQQKGKH